MKLKNQLISAIDVGSSKICTIIAEIDEERQEPIIKGYSKVPSKGIKKGLVSDIELATESIQDSVSRAEKMAETSIDSCWVGLSGDHIQSMNTKGMMAISRDSRGGLGEARQIDEEDVQKLVDHTKAVPLPVDRQLLHVLPQDFIVDNQHEIKNPVALSGRRLEAKVHLTTYNTTIASNLTHCIENVGLSIEAFVLQSLAASFSALDENEKETGTVLIDIGASVLDIIVFNNDGVHHTGVVNLGGMNVTNDIAYLLRIPIDKAESIKREFGHAVVGLADRDAFFTVAGLAGRPDREFQVCTLAEYIEPRMDEIIRTAFLEAKKADFSISNTLSVVLTGGGALLRETKELAESIFNSPARIGYPRGFQGFTQELNDPTFTCAVGILKYAINDMNNNAAFRRTSKNPLSKAWGWVRHLSENVM